MGMINRIGLLIVGIIISLSFYSCTDKKPTQPNILFLLADDWSYPYSELYGEMAIRTPNLVKLSEKGIRFDNAYCAAPSCTPSRAGILTGKYPHNLGEGVNLCGKLDFNIPTFVKILRESGYSVAYDRKGWAPGDYTLMGYSENPCGDKTEFANLLQNLPEEKPFFFWFGTDDPHRKFDRNVGATPNITTDQIKVPPFLPDSPDIRQDLVDYFNEIERFDREIGELLAMLEKSGKLENTIIVVTSDNGMPFPHAKANLYDAGTRVPLIISGYGVKPQSKINNSFVNLIDLMPTFLEMAGEKVNTIVDGISLMPILKGEKTEHRNEIFLERERHCLCRAELDYNAGYPIRAVRNNEFLFIQNFRPDRNPAGDEFIPNTVSEYGDVDGGLTKIYMMDHRNLPSVKPLFDMAFGKRPAEELYELKNDPYNMKNVADLPENKQKKEALKNQLHQWMKEKNDPRLDGKGDEIDAYESTTWAWITRDGIVFWDKKK